jgi:hypothetical protein
VAKIIEFHVPNSLRRNVERVSPVRRGEVIDFGSRMRTKMMCKHNGAPILRSAWVCGLGLELTYQDPLANRGRTNCSGTELSPAVDDDSMTHRVSI